MYASIFLSLLCTSTALVRAPTLIGWGNRRRTRRVRIGPRTTRPIKGPAGRALEALISAAGLPTGPIFRRLHRGAPLSRALSAARVRRIVKARCALAGPDPHFSAHSLRSGFITEASHQGVALADIMAMSGHAGMATVLRYHCRAKVADNPEARLLDAATDDETR